MYKCVCVAEGINDIRGSCMWYACRSVCLRHATATRTATRTATHATATRNCNTHCNSVCCTTPRIATVWVALQHALQQCVLHYNMHCNSVCCSACCSCVWQLLVAVACGSCVWHACRSVCCGACCSVCCGACCSVLQTVFSHPQQLRRHIPKDRKKERKRKERMQCNTLQHETTATNCNKEVIDNVSMTAVCCSCSVLQCCLSPHPNQQPCVPCSAGFTSLLQCVAVLACCSALQCCLSFFPWGCVLVAMRCRACLLQQVAVHRAGWTARVLQCLLVAVSCSAVFFCLFGVLQSITLSLLLVDLAQGRKHCNCNSLQLQHTATCNTLKWCNTLVFAALLLVNLAQHQHSARTRVDLQSVLQCVAVAVSSSCSVWQVAVCCRLQCVAVHSARTRVDLQSVLQCVAVAVSSSCSVLQVAVCCKLKCVAVHSARTRLDLQCVLQ